MAALSLSPIDLNLALSELIQQDSIVPTECVMPGIECLLVGVVEQQSLFGQVVESVKVLDAKVTDAFDAVHYISDLTFKFRPFYRSVNAH